MIISLECTRCTHKCLTDSLISWLTEVGIVHFSDRVGGDREVVSLRSALICLPYPVGCVARSCLRLFAQFIIIIAARRSTLFTSCTELNFTFVDSSNFRLDANLLLLCSSSSYSRFRTLLKVYQVITEHWSDRNGCCCCARFASDRFVLYEIRNWILKSLLPILK